MTDFSTSLLKKTNIYYHVKTGRELRVTKEEIKKFIGISMLMSTLGYPQIRLYWDQAFKIPFYKAQDKLWKVRPVIDKFRGTTLKISRQQEASIDEQMIPFTGHVGFRQFVPRKPNPTGLKNYVLSSKIGLILDFEVY